jgi:hypothetical protein
MENFLNQPFKHSSWFVKQNKETGNYEPYLTNKLAIQYFASCGDFCLNGAENAVIYTGREGGQFTGKQKIDYFKELSLKVKKAKEKAKIEAKKLSKENNTLNYIDNDMLVVIKYWSEKYSLINVSFLEYTETQNPDFLKSIVISN